MLCQVGIFFALISKVMLDHPDVTSTQKSVLGVMLGLGESRTCRCTCRHVPG